MRDYKKIELFLCDFIKNECEKAGAKGVVLGISGGIDSALVAVLAKKALNDNVFALLMPTNSSNQTNLEDALKLCKDLNIQHEILNISKSLDELYLLSKNLDKIRKGNLAARLRMALLYDYSALKSYLVIGTSNKSELKLGYGTIYGDLAHAFNPIGDLYKSEIFDFATYLNLPASFIEKEPSADLYENQSDEKEFGFSYKEIDELLMAMERGDELAEFSEDLKEMVQTRMSKNAFKQRLPKIAKLDEF